MRRFFVKNILFVITVNVLVKPIWVFLIDRSVQNTVPAASYGTYGALLNFSIIFQIVLDFGISSYNSRTIAQHPDKLNSVFPAMLSARLALILVYLALSLGWGVLLGYSGWELSLFLGVLSFQSLNSLVSFIRSNIAALHRFKTDGIISITDRLLMIIICGFLLVYPATAKHFKIEWLVWTQIFCYFVAAVAGYLILKRIGHVKLKFSFHAPTVLKIIRSSFPYALLIFLMSIYNRADMVIIERSSASGKVQAGIYAAAFRQLDMVNILGLMFATMLLPLFGRMISQKEDVQPIVKLCVNMLMPFSFIIAVGCLFFSHDIMHLFYHANALYRDPAMAVQYDFVFACLMASFPAWCLMYVYSTLLTANGSLKTLNIIAFIGVIINLSLNFFLIPRYGAEGGAITSFITQTSLAIAFTVFASRIIKLPLNIRWIAAHLSFVAVAIGLCYVVTVGLRNVSWMFQFVLFGLASTLFMFVFRFISLGSIKGLLNKRQ
jgi:O-antigen/teichoic acid export membrane protein